MNNLIGKSNETSYLVEEQYAAIHVGSGSMRVLSTPSMIAFMERTSHQLIAPYLSEGETSVGITVNIAHKAAVPIHEMVRATAKVIDVQGIRVTLDVNIYWSNKLIGSGTHGRAIVNEDNFINRLQREVEKNDLSSGLSSSSHSKTNKTHTEDD